MKMIVAVDENWGIGRQGELLVQGFKPDLKRFADITRHKAVIYGRKTLATFPGARPLKDRLNVVVSTQAEPGPFVHEGGELYGVRSLDELLALMAKLSVEKEIPSDDWFVIGGASLYQSLIGAVDEVLVTHMLKDLHPDCYFPPLDELPDWYQAESSDIQEYLGLRYLYKTWRRKVSA